jgi:thiol-disulfide isomerase/thioredoxin
LKPLKGKINKLDKVLVKTSITKEKKDSLLNIFKDLVLQEEILIQNFIKENPNSIVSGFELNRHMRIWDFEKVRNLFNGVNPEVKTSAYGSNILKYLNFSPENQLGDKYKDFEAINQNNKKATFSSLKGKITLLNFWASWCLPCRKENPKLLQLCNQYKDKDFDIVGVSIDENRNNWLKAIEKDR